MAQSTQGLSRTNATSISNVSNTSPIAPIWQVRRGYNIITPGPNLPGPPEDGEDGSKPVRSKKPPPSGQWRDIGFKVMESAFTTLAAVAVLGAVGYGYTLYYKRMVLRKIEGAFEPGDPVLELAATGKAGMLFHQDDEILISEHQHREHWFLRDEQTTLDAIVNGTNRGQYHLLVGEKGTGKSSMLIDAMAKVDGEGCAMFEAHADPEIFRIRLGKALDFEFHEDNIGSLFSIRGPRDANALLDIERAFNKLEKVALKRRSEKGKPLVLLIGSMHLIRDDDNGKDLLELLQQRAESWAASNLATVVFNSDDYWVYERLKQFATRMNVIPITDLSKPKAVEALRKYRIKHKREVPSPEILTQVYDLVGGRLAYLNRIAKSPNMIKTAEHICQTEKRWFLNKCWILGEEMDDDVMDQQKYASAAMVMAKALVDKAKQMDSNYDPHTGHILPEIPLHEARQIMTRADFIQSYDAINLFTIDSNAMVRADSVPMMNAFIEVCTQDGFDEHLEATLDRISAIESLGRTRELTLKDLWAGGKYKATMEDGKGNVRSELGLRVATREEGGTGDQWATGS